MTNLLALALGWHDAGRKVALATVVDTWGSAPRPTGSHLVIDADGAMEGSVSGGCVEGAVVAEAQDALGEGASRLLEYGVSDDDAFAVGLACGGRIRVLVDTIGGSLPVDLLRDLVAMRAAKTPVSYVVDLEGASREIGQVADDPARFRSDRSGIAEDGRTFTRIYNPPLRLIVVGAVHIAQHLVPMAQACGFDTVVIDPRGAFGSAARFPDQDIDDAWPDDAIAALAPDARTAVVTLTHDPKLDDPAIIAALDSPAFYIGSLGSTRTHAKRAARLDRDLTRLHAPVGLDIGSKTPAEIAVSIMAQIIAQLRRPSDAA
ncbi:XdhC family protein [Yoonia sp. 208BN28-4]|uniref:XdhC family protein n=1 Tax=Yoonia sp. 208BN28-4 TaxID=3126505 RepID=UPI0030B7051A